MRQAFRSVWQYPFVRVFTTLLVVAALYLLLRPTLAVWAVFLLAFLFAFLLHPVIDFFDRRFAARWLGLVAVVLILLLLLGLASLLVATLVNQVGNFTEQFPELLTQLETLPERLPGFLRGLALPPGITQFLIQFSGSLFVELRGLSVGLVQGLETFVTDGSLIEGVAAVFGNTVRVFALLAITIYLVWDFPRINLSLLQAVPEPYQPLARDLGHKLDHSVGGYFRGQVIIAVIVGLITGGGLALLGVPLAPFLGFLAGIFNLVPYLGVVIAIIPSLLLAIPLGWFQVIGVVVVFIIANQGETHIFSPIILARSTHLHPVTVLVAILLGASLLGLWGAVLAVPIAAFLKLVYHDYYLGSRFYKNG